MDLSSQMILFAHVVDAGSFSEAARRAGHAHSAVSKQIGALEDRLGVRLLTRGQSGIALTEAGAAFYDRCADVAARVAEAEASVVEHGAAPRGTLRVAATVALAKSQLIPRLPAFLARHPELRVALELGDRPVDLAAVDVALSFTEQIGDGDVIVRRLARNRRVIVAAPAYVAAHGPFARAEDLARANVLRLSTLNQWNDWGLRAADGGLVPLKGNFDASSADAIRHAALAGLGVARLPEYLVGGDLRAGRLARILPDYASEDTDIVAMYADRRHLLPRVRVFVDFLVETFASGPLADRT